MNKWTETYKRSFQDIKQDMVSALTSIPSPTGGKLITDVSEGNILVIIISAVAAVVEMLHYYIDNAAREAFLDSARRYSSVEALGLLVDYLPRGANPPTVDIVLIKLTTDVIAITLSGLISFRPLSPSLNLFINSDTLGAIDNNCSKTNSTPL